MPVLSIRNFSCIEQASLDIGQITVLIGPQASGKSVVSKLIYFFAEIFDDFLAGARDTLTYRNIERATAKKFGQWFPPSAWGPEMFEIQYRGGSASIQITRRRESGRGFDEVEVKFSQYLKILYENTLAACRRALRRKSVSGEASFELKFEAIWPVMRDFRKRLTADLGAEYPASQLFVPAGRSSYTNLGRAAVILEHSFNMDEITKDFVRIFMALLDGERMFYRSDKPTSHAKEFAKHQKIVTDDIFGGELKLSSNDRHLATKDGRKIPLSLLSSGQQELLPLILLLKFFTQRLSVGEGAGTNYLFVEEPEAHLFPASQGRLAQHLAEIANYGAGGARLVVTTHSPYVMAKLNNLIQAHLVASEKEENAMAVARVVKRSAWIEPSQLRAYAIDAKNVVSIQDDDGLINATYLDQISNDINEEFMALLEIEAGQ